MIFTTTEPPQHVTQSYSFEIDLEEKFLISDVDPLVLSCCQYRHNDPTSEDYDREVAFGWIYDKVTQADHDLAKNIRNYFRAKIVFAKLRGNRMSKFRQDLAKFLEIEWNPGVKISQTYQGMIYKLPYFYHHDLILASEVFDTEYQEITTPRELGWSKATLTYIRSLDEKQKKNPNINYWFKDHHENRYCISIEKSNPLGPAWEHFIATQNAVTVEGSYSQRSYDMLNFYRLGKNWKIVR